MWWEEQSCESCYVTGSWKTVRIYSCVFTGDDFQQQQAQFHKLKSSDEGKTQGSLSDKNVFNLWWRNPHLETTKLNLSEQKTSANQTNLLLYFSWEINFSVFSDPDCYKPISCSRNQFMRGILKLHRVLIGWQDENGSWSGITTVHQTLLWCHCWDNKDRIQDMVTLSVKLDL